MLETPELLAEAGITSREACGNTVRNITACYRAGTSPTEAFNVMPYSQALFRFLLRNKYNQNLGRNFKTRSAGSTEWVVVPLHWDEVGKVFPTDFTILTAPDRLGQVGDLWADILAAKHDLAGLLS